MDIKGLPETDSTPKELTPRLKTIKSIFEDLLKIQMTLGIHDLHFEANKALYVRESGKMKPLHKFLDFDKMIFKFKEGEARDAFTLFFKNDYHRIIFKGDFLLDLFRLISLNGKAYDDKVAKLAVEQLEQKKNYDASYKLKGVGSFRINVSYSLDEVAIVCRKIEENSFTVNQLGVPQTILNWARRESGLILFTGPTGAGKTTTLVSFVDYINSLYEKHIITIEAPIEFYYKDKKSLITQKEVGIGADVNTFTEGVIYALRQDPDIIVIGEIRDKETMMQAIQAADTGHLVIASVHSTSSIKAIDRICDSFPGDEREQLRMVLAHQLIGVVNQRVMQDDQGKYHTAYEVLNNDTAVSNIIKENTLEQIGTYLDQVSKGNIHLDLALAEAVAKGVLPLSEAFGKSYSNEKAFVARLQTYLNLNYGKQQKLIDEVLNKIEEKDRIYKARLRDERFLEEKQELTMKRQEQEEKQSEGGLDSSFEIKQS